MPAWRRAKIDLNWTAFRVSVVILISTENGKSNVNIHCHFEIKLVFYVNNYNCQDLWFCWRCWTICRLIVTDGQTDGYTTTAYKALALRRAVKMAWRYAGRGYISSCEWTFISVYKNHDSLIVLALAPRKSFDILALYKSDYYYYYYYIRDWINSLRQWQHAYTTGYIRSLVLVFRPRAKCKLDGCIVWNVRNTVFGSKRSSVCTTV